MEAEGAEFGYLTVIGYLTGFDIITIKMSAKVAGEIVNVFLGVVNAAIDLFVRNGDAAVFECAGFGVID